MGDLWAITEDFTETLNVLSTLNYEDLEKVLKARMEALMPPEEKHKRDQKDAAKKMMEKVSEQGRPRPQSEIVELSEEEMSKFFK